MGKNTQKKAKKGQKPTVLIILDGFGLRNANAKGNAITPETAPHIFGYMKDYAFNTLKAHGTDVGLFAGQEGNSEAGHFNIGAGRIVKQDLVRISDSIDDGTFYKNEAFEQAFFHVKKYGTNVHIMGLLTDGDSAHANPEHLYALLGYFRKKKYKKVFLHLFTDGRDSSPHAAVTYLKLLRAEMQPHEQIATMCGRFYGMDRNKIWERTKAAYDLLVRGKGVCEANSAEEAIAQAYNRGETDEFICPTVIVKNGKPVARIADNDAVYFFNARSDRARQITKSFVQKQFIKMNPGAFRRVGQPKNIRFVAMTDFGPDLPGIFTAFPSPDVSMSLPCAIGTHRKQLYISESEKYAHVTYFINGGYADSICGEERHLVRSARLKNFKTHPAMHAKEITKILLDQIEKKDYTFMAVNYPNADMIGHTGDFSAAQRAVSIMDEHVDTVVQAILRVGGQVLITADHGNAECMIHKKTQEMMTQHTTNPVPCIVIGSKYKGKKIKKGRLADVAPTLLAMMGIAKPKEMTGKNLLT